MVLGGSGINKIWSNIVEILQLLLPFSLPKISILSTLKLVLKNSPTKRHSLPTIVTKTKKKSGKRQLGYSLAKCPKWQIINKFFFPVHSWSKAGDQEVGCFKYKYKLEP